jgi:hypothetical protein
MWTAHARPCRTKSIKSVVIMTYDYGVGLNYMKVVNPVGCMQSGRLRSLEKEVVNLGCPALCSRRHPGCNAFGS